MRPELLLADLSDLSDAIPYFLGALLLIFVVYLIGSLFWGRSVLTSKVMTDNTGTVTGADQYYFLPVASLVIKATARVAVTRSIKDKSIIDTALVQLSFDLDTHIEPDTRHLLVLNYNSFLFAHDEMRICTDAAGLLQNVSSDTEDRISAIIAQFADAPKQVATAGEALVARAITAKNVVGVNQSVQVVEYTNTFHILAKEIEDKKCTRDWVIQVDGISSGQQGTVDASFELKIPFTGTAVRLENDEKAYDGVLTRALRKAELEVYTKDKTGAFKTATSLKYDIQIPDISRVMNIPIKRHAFVKNQYVPKFSSGLLIENYINKPSEFEGFLSIPINVLKAIVSIPAALFHFKIDHLQQQTALQTEQNNLAKARREAKEDKQDAKGAKPAARGDKGAGPDGPDDPAPGPAPFLPPTFPPGLADKGLPNLGKLPVDPRAGKGPSTPAARALTRDITGAAALAPPLSSACWYDKIAADAWDTYQNERIPDCVPAAAAHLVMAWTSYSLGKASVIDPAVVIAAYNSIASSGPGNDKGCKIWQFMDLWSEAPGLGGDTIATYVEVTKQNVDKVKTVVQYFGGCIAGMQMPKTAYGQNTWSVPPGGATGDGAPGSWCGHAVPILGYDGTYLYAVSLGQLIKMDYQFYTTYNDECYVALSQTDWGGPSGKSPQGMAYNDLATAIGNLNV